jgi:hypothetical protein
VIEDGANGPAFGQLPRRQVSGLIAIQAFWQRGLWSGGPGAIRVRLLAQLWIPGMSALVLVDMNPHNARRHLAA